MLHHEKHQPQQPTAQRCTAKNHNNNKSNINDNNQSTHVSALNNNNI